MQEKQFGRDMDKATKKTDAELVTGGLEVEENTLLFVYWGVKGAPTTGSICAQRKHVKHELI